MRLVSFRDTTKGRSYVYPSIITPQMLANMITTKEAAQELKLSEGQVRNLANQIDGGKPVLRCVRVGPMSTRLFHRDDVERLRSEREVQALLTGNKKRGPKPARMWTHEQVSA